MCTYNQLHILQNSIKPLEEQYTLYAKWKICQEKTYYFTAE